MSILLWIITIVLAIAFIGLLLNLFIQFSSMVLSRKLGFILALGVMLIILFFLLRALL